MLTYAYGYVLLWTIKEFDIWSWLVTLSAIFVFFEEENGL